MHGFHVMVMMVVIMAVVAMRAVDVLFLVVVAVGMDRGLHGHDLYLFRMNSAARAAGFRCIIGA